MQLFLIGLSTPFLLLGAAIEKPIMLKCHARCGAGFVCCGVIEIGLWQYDVALGATGDRLLPRYTGLQRMPFVLRGAGFVPAI